MTIPFGHRNIYKPDGSTSDSWSPFVCGHCGTQVSGVVVAYISNGAGGAIRWLQCPTCLDGSVLSADGSVHPGVMFGPEIDGLPPEVREAYGEARRCLAANAFTAAEGMCRKILMHVAVDKGAKEGKTFASYIDALATGGYITPPMRDWVTLIKNHGNEAHHLLEPPSQRRAEGTLLFTAQLLRSVYEMGHIASQFIPPSN